jgi:hypothetical protein
MLEVNFTLIKHRINPYAQVGISIVLGWLGMLVCLLGHIPGASEYFAAFIAIVFYSLLNTVISLAHPSFFRYTVPSYYMFIVLLVVLLLSARYTSGISIWNLETYRMMLLPIVMFYAIASILVRALRFLYESAENDI